MHFLVYNCVNVLEYDPMQTFGHNCHTEQVVLSMLRTRHHWFDRLYNYHHLVLFFTIIFEFKKINRLKTYCQYEHLVYEVVVDVNSEVISRFQCAIFLNIAVHGFQSTVFHIFFRRHSIKHISA